jgi:hypothetical protein
MEKLPKCRSGDSERETAVSKSAAILVLGAERPESVDPDNPAGDSIGILKTISA